MSGGRCCRSSGTRLAAVGMAMSVIDISITDRLSSFFDWCRHSHLDTDAVRTVHERESTPQRLVHTLQITPALAPSVSHRICSSDPMFWSTERQTGNRRSAILVCSFPDLHSPTREAAPQTLVGPVRNASQNRVSTWDAKYRCPPHVPA